MRAARATAAAARPNSAATRPRAPGARAGATVAAPATPACLDCIQTITVCIYIHSHTPSLAITPIQSHGRTYTHTYPDTNPHAHVEVRTRAHAHIHAHAYARTHPQKNQLISNSPMRVGALTRTPHTHCKIRLGIHTCTQGGRAVVSAGRRHQTKRDSRS